jgi:hypothetical protein
MRIRDGKNSNPGSGINIPDPQHFPFLFLFLFYIRQIPFLMEADVVGPKIHELVRLAESNEVRGNDPVAPPHQVGNQPDPTV